MIGPWVVAGLLASIFLLLQICITAFKQHFTDSSTKSNYSPPVFSNILTVFVFSSLFLLFCFLRSSNYFCSVPITSFISAIWRALWAAILLGGLVFCLVSKIADILAEKTGMPYEDYSFRLPYSLAVIFLIILIIWI